MGREMTFWAQFSIRADVETLELIFSVLPLKSKGMIHTSQFTQLILIQMPCTVKAEKQTHLKHNSCPTFLLFTRGEMNCTLKETIYLY